MEMCRLLGKKANELRHPRHKDVYPRRNGLDSQTRIRGTPLATFFRGSWVIQGWRKATTHGQYIAVQRCYTPQPPCSGHNRIDPNDPLEWTPHSISDCMVASVTFGLRTKGSWPTRPLSTFLSLTPVLLPSFFGVMATIEGQEWGCGLMWGI